MLYLNPGASLSQDPSRRFHEGCIEKIPDSRFWLCKTQSTGYQETSRNYIGRYYVEMQGRKSI